MALESNPPLGLALNFAGPIRIVVPVKSQDDGHREEAEQYLERLKNELQRLAQEFNKQGGLRDLADQGEFFAERARLEERLDALRRSLDRRGLEELRDEGRDTVGRRYTIRLPDGAVETWEVTPSGEGDPARGRISVRSPLARALAGKSVGEVAQVQTPGEGYTVEVLAVACPHAGSSTDKAD